jgi:RHS repeat-associated protein
VAPDGTINGSIDTNGNYLGDGPDSSGRTVVITTQNGNITYYDVLAPDGSRSRFTVTSVSGNVHTAFGGVDYSGTVGPYLYIQSIQLPNGTSYTFQYDFGTAPGNYGELTQMTLPTGATIQYTWTSFYDYGADVNRWVSGRTTPGGAWTYTTTQNGTAPCFFNPAQSCPLNRLVVGKPDGNQVAYVFNVEGVSGAFVTKVDYYNGSAASGMLLKEVTPDYDGFFRPIRYTTTIPNGASNLVSKFEYTYASTSGLNRLIQWIKEWDFGSGTFGPLRRQTYISYLSSSSYTNLNIINRPLSKIIYNGSGTVIAQTQFGYDESTVMGTNGTAPGHDYTNYSSTFTYRGNMTSLRQWRNTDGAWVTTTNVYDDLGNLRSVTDPRGNTTSYSYADNFSDGINRNAQAYVTQTTLPTTNGVSHIERKQYYWPTGALAASCGQNFPSACANNLATPQPDYAKFTYDFMNRPLSITNGDGDVTSYTYTDTAPITIAKSQSISGALNQTTNSILDALGRVIQTQLCSDPDGNVYTDTTYDSLGRVHSVSNPHRTVSASTDGITTYVYDALGRKCVVVPPDGTAVPNGICPGTQPSNDIFTTFAGNTITVTDQAGKKRQSTTDALGRLTQVVEDPGGLGYVTAYSYDTIDNLTSVLQNGSRQRTFVYNSLSQLTSATNPESGTITYAYDADSNLVTKTSPAPNQTGTATVSTAYSYDTLNRLTGKTYSNGTLPVAYFFDGQTPPSANSPGTGTVTINGSEQSTTATYATGRITVNSVSTPYSQSVTVGGSYTCNFNFPTSVPGSSAAGAIASCLNGHLVTASASSNVVNLTSIVAGTSGNYSLSWSGFSGSLSGMSGGTNGTPDLGTVSVTVNGFNQTVNYGSGSTGTSIASALATAFNGNSSSPVTASASNNVLTLTAKAAGSTSNYSLSASSTYDTTHFPSPSFTPAAFGFSLNGGCSADSVTMTNGIGRRTGMCDPAGAEAWTYDPMGRVLTDSRNTNGIIKSASYTYNLDGSVATLTYPSGRVITYTPGGAGRSLSAVDQANSVNYATAAHYTPAGALAALTNSTGIASSLIYNSRLQPCWIYATTGTPLPWNTTNCSSPAATASILDLKYNFSVGTADNGNVTAITNNRDTTRSQSFTYDSLNRIATAKTTSTSGTTCWDESLGYDPWGNLLTIGRITGYSCSNEELLNASATPQNRISGNTYDTAGNLTIIPAIATYTYNAENQLTTTAGVNYTYDGDGKRVEKSSGKLYWYGMSSDPLDETDLAGNTNNASFNEYIFFGGKRIARRDYSNAVNYYFADHLGTARIVANSSGSVLDDSDFYPFGGERVSLNSSPQNYKFTAKERDSESGLDNFGARYNSSSMGRFMSPDPVFFQAEMLTDPQRFNQYAYVRNNPLALVDPKGEAIELTCSSSDANTCAAERQKQLQALKDTVGQQAGQYLYENKVTTTDANGNTTTSYYVGVYTNGPSGQGPAFGSINSASEAIGNIISDSRVASLNLVPAGTTVTNSLGQTAQIGPIGGNGTPGATYLGQDGKLHVTLLDTSTTSPGQVPPDYMSNGQPGVVDAGILAGHEFGHVRYDWGGFWRHALDSSDRSAVRLENDVRKLRDPAAATRTQH